MKPITVSAAHDYFVQDGKPFFYLADTLWSTFTNIAFEEWGAFLSYRKMQGFNALQINFPRPSGSLAEFAFWRKSRLHLWRPRHLVMA